MSRNMFLRAAVLVVGAGALAGCAGSRGSGAGATTAGAEAIDWERPEEVPAWVDREPGVQGSELLFVGLVDKAQREDLARTDARSMARVELARDLASRIISTWGIGREGEDGRFVTEAAEVFADATVRGARPRDWYTVRYHIAPEAGGRIEERYYRVYVLMGIPVADFLDAKKSALRSVAEKVATDKHREAYERLDKEIHEGAWPYTSQ